MTSDEAAPTTEDVLYGDPAILASTLAPYVADSLDRLQDASGMSNAERQELLTDVAIVFNDARIPSQQAPRLFNRIASAIIAPPDDATCQVWTTEARQAVRTQFGDAADARLETARAFVAGRPGLEKLLNTSGAGSHVDWVLALVENAHTLRMKPRTSIPR